MSFTVLTLLLNATSGIPNKSGIPVVSSPKGSAVQVQSILFSSLASALLAAFLAMLGKQWLNLLVEGSLIDRSRHRELRMRGMITWRFKIIMECLPLVMQVSLLLLGYALARYLWDLSRTVSAIIATFTVFGLLFYLSIVFAATVWKTCQFQTPVPVVLRYILSLVNQRKYDQLREIRDRLSAAARFKKNQLILLHCDSRRVSRRGIRVKGSNPIWNIDASHDARQPGRRRKYTSLRYQLYIDNVSVGWRAGRHRRSNRVHSQSQLDLKSSQGTSSSGVRLLMQVVRILERRKNTSPAGDA